MAIVNRDCDGSQQRDVVHVQMGALATGVTVGLAIMPYPCVLETMKHGSFGVSGSPILTLLKIRGTTIEAIGISGIVLSSIGTSGSQGFSGLAASGSTLLSFNTGDALLGVTSGSNSAVTALVMECVVKKIQDIVSYN